MSEIDDRPDGQSEEPLEGPVGEEAAQRPSKSLLVLSSVISLIVLGGALAAPLIARAAGYEREPADLSGVQTWKIEDATHTDGDTDYPQTPSAGGPHAPVWLDCGVYDEPVREENVTHDLEHGTVWITHDPALPERDVRRLAELLPDNGIMSPYDGLRAPVVITVWGAQLALDGADEERLRLFLEEYGDGHTAPEFGASCHGGTSDPTGAVPEPGVNA